MRFRYLAIPFLMTAAPATGAAQDVNGFVTDGDSAYAAMEVAPALASYTAAIKADSSHYEALWKASRTAVDLAEYEPDARRKAALYADAERYARLAVTVDPNDAEGQFSLARALGRVALTKGIKERIRYATDVRAAALRALELNPDHPGALHVLGRWNAEVRRVNGVSRFIARKMLGGKVFGEASWEDARRYMERAVAVDPHRLVHHLGLAEIYLDIKERDKAREQLQLVVDGEQTDYNDPHYKREAAALLEKLK